MGFIRVIPIKDNLIDFASFCLIMGYITLFLKETKSGWNLASKPTLYVATAFTFIFSGLIVGFTIILLYIFFAVIILIFSLPHINLFLKKRRKH